MRWGADGGHREQTVDNAEPSEAQGGALSMGCERLGVPGVRLDLWILWAETRGCG